MKISRFVLLCAMVAVTCCSTHAAFAESDRGTLSLHFENDLFGNTDANYTNGLKVSWISPDLTRYKDSPQLPRWSHWWIDKLPFIHRPGLQRNVVFSLGQSIFTPEDIVSSTIVEDDRPYAGWLYFGTGFHNKNATWLDTMELQFGVIGEASLAEEAQDLVHRVRDIERAQGWQHQLETEPGIAIIYERKWRAYRRAKSNGFGFDLVTHLGGSLGNVYTYANVGGEMRAGWNVPQDFGSSLIRPGGDTNAPLVNAVGEHREGADFGLHFFAALDGRAVLRDIFLDGNTFQDSHSVDKRHFVADFSAGASLVYGRYKLSFARAMRTREFHGQASNHRFGSVTLSVTF